MQIVSNPWIFLTTDVLQQTISTITLNADGTVTVVLSASTTFPTGFGNYATIAGVANAAYVGFYIILSGSGTTYTLLQTKYSPGQSIPAGTAASSGGNMISTNYPYILRAEDMSWQQVTTAGHILTVYDRQGNLVWPAAAYAPGFQNRGKAFWINGLAIQEMDSGKLVVTVN